MTSGRWNITYDITYSIFFGIYVVTSEENAIIIYGSGICTPTKKPLKILQYKARAGQVFDYFY